MKLAHQQLEQHLATKLAPIYLVSSDEILLVQETVAQIRAAATAAGYSERIRIIIESGSDWGNQLFTHSHALSLFATKRIIELDLRNAKINQAQVEMLQSYAEHPPADTILILSSNKLDQKSEKSRWYQAIEKNSIVIQIWPITPEQLPTWILQRAKKINLTLSKSTAAFLAEQVEGNLLAAAQELEKLRLLQTTETLDEQTIENTIADNAQFDIFNLVDAMLAGNSQRSLRILNTLFAEDAEPTLMLWAISRELRTMSEIATQQSQGGALSSLFSKYRIWDKRQPAARAFLKRHSPDNCWKLLLSAGKIDRIIKGAELGNLKIEFERILLNAARSVII